jgi:hypothetical protein
MSARILKPKTALITLLGELRYTLSRLHANPLTTAHVATFQALRDEWRPVLDKEISLQEALSDAQALIDAEDAALDDFASRVSKTVLTITKDDRGSALYTHFFGNKSLSEFRRPNLGAQLEAMRPWGDSLANSPFPALKAMAKEHAQLVAAADKAVSARDKARQQNKQFREVGERRQFVDKLNAARKVTHGALAKLALETPGLPSGFADQFFRSEASRDEGDDEETPPTIAQVTETIDALEAQLTSQKALLAKLQGEAEAATKAAAAREADQTALSDLQQRMAEMAKQAEQIQKRLGSS